jgi:hypothetical protein
VIVVDDALLLVVLARTASDELTDALSAGRIATTGSWYWRLARALHDPASAGALSRAFNELPVQRQAAVIAFVGRLPAEIATPSLRRLVPVMAAIDVGRRLNLLTAEAVATAVVLEGSIAVTTQSSLMTHSCEQLGVDLRLVTV